MRQICNLIYHRLTDGKSAAERAEIDVLLTEPRDKEKMIAKQNAEAMKQLMGTAPAGMIRPPLAKPEPGMPAPITPRKEVKPDGADR